MNNINEDGRPKKITRPEAKIMKTNLHCQVIPRQEISAIMREFDIADTGDYFREK